MPGREAAPDTSIPDISIDVEPDGKMVRSLGIDIDKHIPNTGKQLVIDKAVIEMRLLRSLRRFDPAIAIGRQAAEARQHVNRLVGTKGTSVKMVVMSDHGDIFRRFGLHVEIAHHHKLLRQRQFGKLSGCGPRQRTTLRHEVQHTLLEERDLGNAFIGRNMIEMHRIGADGTTRRIDDGLDGAALQVELLNTVRARQQQMARRKDGPTRQDHVTELKTSFPSPAVFDHEIKEDIATGPVRHEEIGKQVLQGGNHVDVIVFRRVACDLLQGDHIGSGNACRDTLKVETAIETKTVLDVIADELHDNL